MVLLIEDDQRVRTLRINRPDALNAMNNATFSAIRDALAEAQDDERIAVVVLTGTGRAFCAGQDLTEMLATRGPDAEPHQFPSMLEMVTGFRKPLIARQEISNAEREKMLMPIEFPDNFFVARFTRVEFVKLFPMFERNMFSGNRFVMPIDICAEIEI